MEQQENKKSVLPIILIAIIAVLALLSGFLGWRSVDLQKKLEKCAGDTTGFSKKFTAENDSLTLAISDLKSRYDSLSALYGGLDSLFKAEKDRIVLLEAQLRNASSGNTGNTGTASSGGGSASLKAELALLKSRQDDYIMQIDSLKENNRLLTLDNIKIKSDLEIERDKVKGYDKQIADLNNTIEKGSVLAVAHIDATALQTKGSNEISTDKARKASKMRCCFSVAKNTLVKPGYKDFYIRAIGADGKVVKMSDGSSGEMEANGSGTINYTTKASVLYENENVETCVYTFPTGKKTFDKGTYKFEIYYNGDRVSSTSITLK